MAKPFTRGGVTYPSQGAYRRVLTERAGFSSRSQRAKIVKAERELARLTKPQQQARGRVLEAISLVRRERHDLGSALKVAKTTRASLQKYGGDAVEQEGRTLRVREADTLARSMRVVTPEGTAYETILSSKDASLLGNYWADVKWYLLTGDASGLARYEGKSITIRGNRQPLITDLETLKRLASAGELEFDNLYELG